MAMGNTPTFKLESVSTHSRPKAAEPDTSGRCWCIAVSTHSRPKAAVGIGADDA